MSSGFGCFMAVHSLGQFAAIGVLLASAVNAQPRPVVESRDVQLALRSMYDEIVANWVVIDEPRNPDLLLASTPRVLEITNGFCVRDFVRLTRDEHGAIASLAQQIEEATANARPMVFQKFSFTNVGDDCSAPGRNFLSLMSLDARPPTVQFLDLLTDLRQRNWSSAASRFAVQYEDNIARRCLNGERPIEILEASELIAEASGSVYRAEWGVCILDGSEFLVYTDVEVSANPSDPRRVFARSISKAEADCIELECLR